MIYLGFQEYKKLLSSVGSALVSQSSFEEKQNLIVSGIRAFLFDDRIAKMRSAK